MGVAFGWWREGTAAANKEQRGLVVSEGVSNAHAERTWNRWYCRASSLSTRLLASLRALPGGRRAPAVRMSAGPVPFDPSHCGQYWAKPFASFAR